MLYILTNKIQSWTKEKNKNFS